MAPPEHDLPAAFSRALAPMYRQNFRQSCIDIFMLSQADFLFYVQQLLRSYVCQKTEEHLPSLGPLCDVLDVDSRS